MEGYGQGAFAGRSLLGMLWQELDTVIDRLVADGEPDLLDKVDESCVLVEIPDAIEEFKQACKAWGEERGQAQGLAYAIAVITHKPNRPDVPAIKKQAMKRWESRQES